MLKRLAPEANILVPAMQSVLCILKPTRYRPRWEKRIVGMEVADVQFRQLPKLQQLLIWPSYRQYYVGAPRDKDYMLELALEFLNDNAPKAQIDLLMEASQAADISDSLLREFNQVHTAEGVDFKPWPLALWQDLEKQEYDAIILLYADALGYGWKHLERQIKRSGVESLIALNGRRRAFIWDRAARAALARRRFLESWILLELVLTPLVYLVAIPLAVIDFVRQLFSSRRDEART